uniref:Uncharacterized protein n=1 Tax=Chaetoceros debilis TaxID=122233 RepID=A0A7S3PUB6_9STRA|mmetsp:Transcript_5475/g.8152  ORF Transcript_5475/g.8152 Transcript_5475/m.8152 type:complete len:224 (+) Transcript_5475:60-731(+)|eukprot:CAMPEP_0194084214 /NCGR_PEP_ID=MMETSP0149-20130528/12273_1 /TAXON_ID=122233 /ORGANISM="Chaetoceros debilis, Strain MM31A-1" /LENGTH=223 /DNA_ID=CAMNT_0038766813 /DNA_START=60 /DNA_END=731 /DNA_ORIENTATION=-
MTSEQVEVPLMPTNVRLAYSDDRESLSVRNSVLPLVDPDSTLEIPKDVADGFLILLSSGIKSFNAIKVQKEEVKEAKKSSAGSGEATAQSPLPDSSTEMTSEELSAIQLAFAALTDGNVIEATFGVESTGGLKRHKNTSEVAYNASKAAKQAIMDAAIPSDSIRQLAVETYIKAFEIVVTYHINLSTVGFITWCFKHQKFRDTAADELMSAFGPLAEAIAASI